MKFVRLLNDQGCTYDSYTDFWALVRLAGFETCEQNEVRADADETYILPMNSGTAQCIAGQPRSPRCRMICWQLERPANGVHELVPPCWDEVWISDRWLAARCQPHHPRVKFVPIGGHAGLGGAAEHPPQYDFAVMSYLWGWREAKVNGLREQGFRIAPNAWGDERSRILASCRRGLCLHQDNLPVVEPLRYTLFACWKLPLVCDCSTDPYPYRTCGLSEIALADDWETNYGLLTGQLTFRACVEAAA